MKTEREACEFRRIDIADCHSRSFGFGDFKQTKYNCLLRHDSTNCPSTRQDEQVERKTKISVELQQCALLILTESTLATGFTPTDML